MERGINVRHDVTGQRDGETGDEAHSQLQPGGLALHQLDAQERGETQNLQKHPSVTQKRNVQRLGKDRVTKPCTCIFHLILSKKGFKNYYTCIYAISS